MAWRPAYATKTELIAYLGGGTYSAGEQTSLDLACESASRVVDRFCGRQFGLLSAATARLYTARWDADLSCHVAIIDDLMTSTGLVITSDGTTITDYTLYPLNAAGDGRPWTELLFGESVSTVLGELSVTAKFGWTTVPDTIHNATMLQAERLYKRKDAPFGIAGSPDMGSEQRLLSKVDPDVAVMLRDYRRQVWAA
jgi:hypothetical protein